jgi:ribosome-associated protein
MRKLTDRLREEAKARADDRDLTSRSDLRREENAKEIELKRLALELVGLKAAQLGRLQLDAELLEAIEHAQALGDRKAKGRQIGVVRQQLRALGTAGFVLRDRVAALKTGTLPRAPAPAPESKPKLDSASEGWVERLLAEGEGALEEFFAAYPEADRQTLRQGVRAMLRALDSGVTTPTARRASERLREEIERWV